MLNPLRLGLCDQDRRGNEQSSLLLPPPVPSAPPDLRDGSSHSHLLAAAHLHSDEAITTMWWLPFFPRVATGSLQVRLRLQSEAAAASDLPQLPEAERQ
jgi:hypothetical protein